MRRFRVPLGLVVCLFVAAPAAPQERPGTVTPPRDRTAAAPAGTAKLKGRILTSEGTPVGRAQVMLSSADSSLRRTLTSGRDGRWEATALPAGRYLVSASKGGYVTVQYGQRRTSQGGGTPIVLGDGQSLEQIDIVLLRGGVITGRVLDDNGEPLAGAQIQAQRYQYMPDGQKRPVTAGFATSDDLGQFRVFGLAPGEYAVNAGSRGIIASADTSPEPSASPETLGNTYYPGTLNPNEAQVISIGAGQETSLQIQLLPTRVGHIGGIVINSEGKPVGGAQLMLAASGDVFATNLPGGITVTRPDGNFAYSNIPSGDYTISVRPSRPDQDAEFANVPVTVGADTINVRIVTGKGPLVSGRVTWDGQASRAMPALSGIAAIGALNAPRVTLQPASPGINFATPPAPGTDGTIAADGTFTVAGGAGKMFVRVSTPPGWTLRSVTLDGRDITDIPIDLTPGAAIDDVHIVITDKLSNLSGHVTDARGTAVTDCVVVLLPSDLAAGVWPQRFVRLVRPDQDGQFRVRGMPAGRYTATALESIEPGRQFVPEYQEELRRQGKALSIREGETVTIDLKLSGL
jgi:hypothetical protein